MCFLTSARIWFACVPLICSIANAYPVRVFDSKDLLENAELVCYGTVVSVKPHELQVAGVPQKGTLATVEVLSTIKGNAPSPLLVFCRDGQQEMRRYTSLEEKETVILFLKPAGDVYRFVNEDDGKLTVPLHKALEYKSQTAAGRLVEELVFVATSDAGDAALFCITELGRFQRPEVIAQLRTLSASADMAIQGTAYLALVKLDEPPDVGALTDFFKRPDKTMGRYHSTNYGNSVLKLLILEQMSQQFNIITRDYGLRGTDAKEEARGTSARAAGKKWASFDLVTFVSSVLAEDTKRALFDDETWGGGKNEVPDMAYRSLAEMLRDQVDKDGFPAAQRGPVFRPGSKALIVQLLQKKGHEAAIGAAYALDCMIASPKRPRYPNIGRSEIDAYVASRNDWLAAHPAWLEADK